MVLATDEQIEIDRAEHNGQGWALPPDYPGGAPRALSGKRPYPPMAGPLATDVAGLLEDQRIQVTNESVEVPHRLS